MKRIFLLFVFVFFSFVLFAQEEEGQNCTSIMVGRLASTDGSVITSHTCDGKYRSWIEVEPAADYAPGAKHIVRKGVLKTSCATDTKGVTVAGSIPETSHTYRYLNSGYPCLNEKQLGIGETTFNGPDTLRNRNAMFNIEELERIAMQRCSSAREAVILMGRLAERYGYGDGGECLTVADPNEVWHFEIIGVGKEEKGAAWVAKRIPDGEVGVSANIPRIGTFDRSDKANVLASDNVEAVALKYGLWDGKGPFSFWKAFHSSYGDGRNYSYREFWILSTLAPSLGLKYGMPELPLSVKPDAKVDVRTVFELLRSTYEGTDWDMTRKITEKGKKSPVANPWMTNTWKNTLNEIHPGIVESRRTVSVAWCAYSTVIQLRGWLPDAVGGICWYSVDNPAQSPRIPMFAGNTALPEAYSRCGQNNYWPDCALWQFRRANKLATLTWQTSKDEFMKDVREIEDKAFEGLPDLEKNPAAKNLDAYTARIYRLASERWDAMEARYWLKSGQGF